MRSRPGEAGTAIPWGRLLTLVGAVGLVVAFLPRPVGADSAHTEVHIVDPDDPTIQAQVEDPDFGHLMVSTFGSGGGAGAVLTELLTPDDPVGVLLERDPGERVPVTSVFGVATPSTRVNSHIEFAFVLRGPDDPPCDSPAGTLDTQDLATMWVAPKGQAQIEFPIVGAQPGPDIRAMCVVAYLLSGGPVNASGTGPFI